MIIFIYGKDNFTSLRQLKILQTEFIKRKQGEVITIDKDNFDWSLCKHHLKSQGLFAKNKLIILKDLLSSNNQEIINQVSYILDSNILEEITIIFFERNAVDKRLSIFKKLSALSVINGKQFYPEFVIPQPSKINRWILNRLKRYNKEIDKIALAFLTDACVDMWQVYNETEKLIASPYNPVTLKDVQELVLPKLDDNIFALTDAVSLKNKKRALHLLQDQFLLNREPLYLLAMIGRQIKILVKIKSALVNQATSDHLEIADNIKEHPYVVQKTIAAARSFSLNHLILMYERVLKTDILLKSSSINPKTLLIRLVYDILE